MYNLDLNDPEEREIFEELIEDTQRSINLIENNFHQLKNQPQKISLIDDMMRLTHNTKGRASFFSLDNLSLLCHELENVLKAVKEGSKAYDDTCHRICQAVINKLQEISQQLDNGTHIDTSTELENLIHFLNADRNEDPNSIDIYRLVYTSEAIAPFDIKALLMLLEKSRDNNEKLNVTGCLTYEVPFFMQYLEGPKESVDKIFNKIKQDERHHQVEIKHIGYARKRQFAQWSMGFKHMKWLDKAPIKGLIKQEDEETFHRLFERLLT